jgi:cytoskeletal protein CcmA (bactofilin family)
MFSKSSNMSKTNFPETGSVSVNIIGPGTVITGDINTNGDMRVDGNVNGKLVVKGKLVLGSTGQIEGEVTCQNADISGGIKGKITVSELLSLKGTARINGDIITNKLAIEPGANFTGSCSMGGVVKEIKHAGTEASKQEKAAGY